MPKKRTKGIVVDTSVATAAGNQNSDAPGNDPASVASLACSFLRSLREYGHFLVMSDTLQKEWLDYRSRFATRWLADMRAKQRVISPPPAYLSFRRQIASSDFSEGQKSAMTDDAHLIEAAVATDHRVASLDDEVREIFKAAVTRMPDNRLADIVWVNPTRELETPIEWLEAGAPADPHRKLGHTDCPKTKKSRRR